MAGTTSGDWRCARILDRVDFEIAIAIHQNVLVLYPYKFSGFLALGKTVGIQLVGILQNYFFVERLVHLVRDDDRAFRDKRAETCCVIGVVMTVYVIADGLSRNQSLHFRHIGESPIVRHR